MIRCLNQFAEKIDAKTFESSVKSKMKYINKKHTK